MKMKFFDMEFKRESVDDVGVFSGYGSTFGNMDAVRDIILPGAFTKTLAERTAPVRLLWQHDWREPIGVFDSLSEDGNGLKFNARLALGTQRGREAYELMKMGAVDRMSVGFSVSSPDDVEYADGVTKYKAVTLHEISVVTFPANKEAVINSVKAEDDFNYDIIKERTAHIKTERDFERLLRDVGLSSKISKALTATWKQFAARDAGTDDVLAAASKLRKMISEANNEHRN